MILMDQVNETKTKEVAEKWFDSLNKGDTNTAFGLIADDVEWANISPTKGISDIMPWIGAYRGKDAVLKSFDVWAGKSKANSFELYQLIVKEDEAVGFVHENATCLANGNSYDLYVATYLNIKDGKIAKWRVYWDPSPLISAYRGM